MNKRFSLSSREENPLSHEVVYTFAGVAGAEISSQPTVLWVPYVGPLQMIENNGRLL